MAVNQPLQHQHEFLPLCDVLFNIISLASYFCDVVFDLAMAYALANHRAVPPALFPISVALVVTALLISQTVSLRWYLWGTRGKLTRDTTIDGADSSRKNHFPSWMVWCVVLLHSTQIGVLWRYFKLFIPVDLAYVKHENLYKSRAHVRSTYSVDAEYEMMVAETIEMQEGPSVLGLAQIGGTILGKILFLNEAESFDEFREASLAGALGEIGYSSDILATLGLYTVAATIEAVSHRRQYLLPWRKPMVHPDGKSDATLVLVRELCVLRLIHAFCEAAPMLLLQLYLLSIGIGAEMRTMTSRDEKVPDRLNTRESNKLAELTAVSAGLSLWSVCWAVASFSKGAARLRNLERLVLTWLGVLAQLAWRLGTVSARVGALVAYASLYGGQWLLVVIALHWLSMLTWLLLTPDGLFHGGERLTFCRKGFLASLLAFVYVFAYVNLHETNHRQKMIIFYTVMFLENSLLIGVWAVGVNGSDLQHHPRPITLVLILLALFFGGLFFMGLYYRFFHIRRLRYEAGGRMNENNIATMLTNQDISEEKRIDYGEEKKISYVNGIRKAKLTNGGIPGVFNCRFTNPTATNLNRKKKKPTTFVPPPVQQTMTSIGETKQWSNSNGNMRQLIPFWKRPLSVSMQDDWAASKNDIDVAVGSLNANLIREKLREKKQQQLRELRAIQEEIKEGKLVPPPSASTSSFSSSLSAANQQPPPNTKLHTSPNSPLSGSPASLTVANAAAVTLASWPPIKMHCLMPPVPSSPYHPTSHPANIWKGSQQDRADTPEILLAPRCLPHHYPHWTPSGHRLTSNQNGEEESSKGEGEGEGEISDVEGSQVSLPRSYTLPREFKYNNSNNALKERRGPSSKLQPSRFYLPSTNSSDGDVDSADNEETDSELHARTQNAYGPGSNEIHLRCFAYESGDATDLSNAEVNTSSAPPMASLGYYISNSYGVLRPNPLLRAKVKHETKL